jgi:serine/threonine-protein kinase
MLAGRYRVFGLVGKGGMGEVYRADDLKLGQAVALKFLPVDVEQDAERLSRFLDEVRIARQISHPNVCRVYDVGEVDGHHFLSMEFVDGEDLASLLRRIGRLPRDKALQIARQMCAGLAAAHEQGVLHRDLKPGNVMIDGRGRARITDFGLARLAGEIQNADVVAGTPAYMAPEQISGKGVTVRSDIYALGLVLYELCTGQPAFKGTTAAELARQKSETAPASPGQIVDGFDPAIERVILRCLERDPANRPASALQIAAALPGGDPLAAALAAGETPSPELVAEAGAVGGLTPAVAWTCLAAFFVLSIAAQALSS